MSNIDDIFKKKPEERIREILNVYTPLRDDLLEIVKIQKRNKDPVSLQLADQKSTEILSLLMRIYNIAEKNNDQSSMNSVLGMMNNIKEIRESIGLKMKK